MVDRLVIVLFVLWPLAVQQGVVQNLAVQQGVDPTDAETRVLVPESPQVFDKRSLLIRLGLVARRGAGDVRQTAGPTLRQSALGGPGDERAPFLDRVGSLFYFFWRNSLMMSTSPQ